MRFAARALLALCLVVVSCDLDYGKDQASADQVPQLEFHGLHQTAVKDGRVLYTMDAAGSEVFTSKKQVRLKNFRFQEYDSEGKPASQGTADSALINTATNDATLTGALTARSEDLGVTLSVQGGGGLTWVNDDRLLKTLPPSTVRLRKDDGSEMTAGGLSLDLGTNQLELLDTVQGRWTAETKHNASTPPLADLPPPVAAH